MKSSDSTNHFEMSIDVSTAKIKMIDECQAFAMCFVGITTEQEIATHSKYSPSSESNLLRAFHVAVMLLSTSSKVI